MSKKATPKKTMASNKSKQLPLAVNDDQTPWVNDLASIVINDADWNCNVSIMMETNSHNSKYINAFCEVFTQGENVRPKIKIISNQTLAMETLENSFLVGVEISNAFQKLCKEALKYYAPDGFTTDIPNDILAALIKYQIHKLKLKNIEEKAIFEDCNRKKEKFLQESLQNIQNILNPTTNVVKGKQKKITSKKTQKPGTKPLDKFTNLRKRGEEFLDHKTVSDETADGPELYIILCSFMQVMMPLELLKLHVPLVSFIRLENLLLPDGESMLTAIDYDEYSIALESISTKSTIKQRKYSNPKDECEILNTMLKSFWETFSRILGNKKNVLFFKDTIFLKYSPRLDEIIKLDTNHKQQWRQAGKCLQKSIYKQFCFIQYDMQDVKRQHENYKKNLNICDLRKTYDTNINNTQLYFSMIGSVPPEVINVPFILHCMLMQVEYLTNNNLNAEIRNNDEEEIASSIKKDKTDWESRIHSTLNKLDEENDLLNARIKINKSENKLNNVLMHEDDIELKTFWWKGMNHVKTTTIEILKCFWESILRKQLPVYNEIPKTFSEKYDYDLFNMFKNTGNLSVFYKLSHLPCLYSDIIVEDKASVFCSYESPTLWKERSQYNEIDNDYNNNEETNKLKHFSGPTEGYFVGQIYDQHSFCFEEMTPDILLQNIFNSYESFNCLDLTQNYFEDKIYLKFHHRMTCCREECLMGTLRTPTALRDFYDYTIDEEFYWLNEQEICYNKKLKSKDESKLANMIHKQQDYINKIIIKTQEICRDKNFVTEGTLKFNSSKEKHTDPISSPVASDTDEKINSEPEFICNFSDYLQAFDIDLPNRVQFSEKNQDFFLSKHCKLHLKKLSRLYDKDEIFLQVTIYGHTLYFFRPENLINIDFHVVHNSGMIIHFKKLETVTAVSVSLEDRLHMSLKGSNNIIRESTNSRTVEARNTKTIDNFFKPLVYNLSVSLPNALYFEVVNAAEIPLYFKQFYLSNCSQPSSLRNEKFRCYSLDGKIIKFMNDEKIIIYHSNSEICVCEIHPTELSTTLETVRNINPTLGHKKSKDKSREMKQGKYKKYSANNPKTSSVNYFFEYTQSTGRRILVKDDKITELEPLFCQSFMDIKEGVNTTQRSDGTVLIHSYDGTLVATFQDGSRITTTATFAEDEVLCDEKDSTDITNVIKPKTSNNEMMDARNMNSEREGFVLVNIQHFLEHPKFASVSVNTIKENLSIKFPFNVDINLGLDGLFNVNFDSKAKLITGEKILTFQEINSMDLPECNIHLSDPTDSKSKIFFPIGRESCDMEFTYHSTIFSSKDSSGNRLIIDNNGDVQIEMNENNGSICKCKSINNNRLFIFDKEFNGLEVFPSNKLDLCDEEEKITVGCVTHNFATTDHQVLLLLKPLFQNESEKWMKKYQEIIRNPQFSKPSTYRDEHARYNPFPKRNQTSKTDIPEVFLVTTINRVNCNIHLQKETFLQNKKEADHLRRTKDYKFAVKMYNQGNKPFYKADKEFVNFIKDKVIESLILRTQRRVMKRYKTRIIKESKFILKERILYPYFQSCCGIVHAIMIELIFSAVKISEENKEKLLFTNLLKKPLNSLTSDDINFVHDYLISFRDNARSNSTCCSKTSTCKLKTLLLAGKALQDDFPDIISYLYAYSELFQSEENNINNTKRNISTSTSKVNQDIKIRTNTNLLKELLMKPTYELTEDDLRTLHDEIKCISTITICNCHENPKECKLKVLLVAGTALSDLFPNLDTVLKAYKVNIDLP